MLKCCRRCQLDKPLHEFYPNTHTKDGLTSWCKTCTKRSTKKERAFPATTVTLPALVRDCRSSKNLAWIDTYLLDWSCPVCRTRKGLWLYDDQGRKIDADSLLTLSWDDLFATVRRSEVWCGACASLYFHSLSRIIRRNRRGLVEEAIAATNARFHVRELHEEWPHVASAATVTTKQQVVAFIVSQVHCAVCGEDAPETLDFVHLEPETKSKAIQTMIADTSSLTALLAELEKCIVLCANCVRRHAAGRVSLDHAVPLRLQEGVACNGTASKS